MTGGGGFNYAPYNNYNSIPMASGWKHDPFSKPLG